MSAGMIGAPPEDLRSLANTMGHSGTTLKNLAGTLNNVNAQARWQGPDSEKFRTLWNTGMRVQLPPTGDSLSKHSSLLVAQAADQDRASAGTGGTAAGGSGSVGSTEPSSVDSPLQTAVDANGNPLYQSGNTLTSRSGLLADNLLTKMINGGLVREASWSLLSARAGQLGEYVKGTRLLNGLSMAGRAAGVLSVIGGGLEFADGLANGNPTKCSTAESPPCLLLVRSSRWSDRRLPWQESRGQAWACWLSRWDTAPRARWWAPGGVGWRPGCRRCRVARKPDGERC